MHCQFWYPSIRIRDTSLDYPDPIILIDLQTQHNTHTYVCIYAQYSICIYPCAIDTGSREAVWEILAKSHLQTYVCNTLQGEKRGLNRSFPQAHHKISPLVLHRLPTFWVSMIMKKLVVGMPCYWKMNGSSIWCAPPDDDQSKGLRSTTTQLLGFFVTFGLASVYRIYIYINVCHSFMFLLGCWKKKKKKRECHQTWWRRQVCGMN